MNALRDHPGVVDLTSTVTAEANRIVVVIQPRETSLHAVARVAEEALESDPANPAPVTVIIE